MMPSVGSRALFPPRQKVFPARQSREKSGSEPEFFLAKNQGQSPNSFSLTREPNSGSDPSEAEHERGGGQRGEDPERELHRRDEASGIGAHRRMTEVQR